MFGAAAVSVAGSCGGGGGEGTTGVWSKDFSEEERRALFATAVAASFDVGTAAVVD